MLISIGKQSGESCILIRKSSLLRRVLLFNSVLLCGLFPREEKEGYGWKDLPKRKLLSL